MDKEEYEKKLNAQILVPNEEKGLKPTKEAGQHDLDQDRVVIREGNTADFSKEPPKEVGREKEEVDR